jgi:superfamily II DNA/RNA helicase
MTYIHRIGRTARAGATGTAVTFVDWEDVPRWKLICDELELPFHEPVETYSTSEHLLLDLDIPEGTRGTLPRAARTRAGLDAEQIEDLGGRDARQSGGRRRSPRSPDRRERSHHGERAEQTEAPARPARTRARKRTRGGKPIDETVADATSAEQQQPASERGNPVGENHPDSGSAAPRRRRRGGRGRGGRTQPSDDATPQSASDTAADSSGE